MYLLCVRVGISLTFYLHEGKHFNDRFISLRLAV